MPSVTEIVELPGQVVASPSGVRVVVELALVGADARPVRGFDSSNNDVIVSPRSIVLPTNGTWSENLVGNAGITPAGTAYRRTVSGPDYAYADYFEVPTTGGPYNVRQLLTDPPGAIATSALQAAETRLKYEARGSAVDQTAARVMEERFLGLIRSAGSSLPARASWRYLGADLTEIFKANGGAIVVMGADGYDGVLVDADDTYSGTALPQRNWAFLGLHGDQLYNGGGNGPGVWLDAVANGGLAAGTLWWPIAGMDDVEGVKNRIACWHVQNGVGPWGKLLDNHIVTLNAFGTYESHIAVNLGVDTFWIVQMTRDAVGGFTYIYGLEFIPDYDADVNNDGSVPNYGKGSNLDDHYTRVRVARVTNGQLLTIANWQFWNGTTWVSGAGNAVAMKDSGGAEIRGDASVLRVGTNDWRLVAHQFIDTHVSVYRGTAPQGPWTLYCRVPAPGQGESMHGGTQVGQFAKFVPADAAPAPTRHVVVSMARNMIDTTEAFANQSILRYCPQFVVVPLS